MNRLLSDFIGLLSSKICLPWQRDITTSPLYTSHRQGYKMASAMPDSSENLQLSQRNGGPEPVTIARDRSLLSTNATFTCKIYKRLYDTPRELPNSSYYTKAMLTTLLLKRAVFIRRVVLLLFWQWLK